jgi:hypothetical protein
LNFISVFSDLPTVVSKILSDRFNGLSVSELKAMVAKSVLASKLAPVRPISGTLPIKSEY